MNIKGKNVLIIGSPRAGKTTLAKKLKTPHHLLISTDHFLRYGNDIGLQEVIKTILYVQNQINIIVEGTLGYRLLRKIQEKNLNINFDLIINVNREVFLNDGQKRLHTGNLNILKELKDLSIVDYNDEEKEV